MSQVLDQEKGIKDVQTVRRSVQGEDVRVLEQPTSEGQTSCLGGRKGVHQAVLGRLQTELLQNRLGLEFGGVAATPQQHVKAQGLLSRQAGTQAALRWQVSDARSVLLVYILTIDRLI